MINPFSRTERLFGKNAMQKLAASRVAVFGAGGVGGYVLEALARSGVGAIDIIDSDEVSVTNINRQILATRSSVGRAKVDVAAERIADINPDCKVTTHKLFYLPENADMINFNSFDYIVDAIDTVTGKIAIIERAKRLGVPIISCMGTGNKTDPSALKVSDIYKTSVCPLARVMRRELKKRGVEALKVVYSEEEPVAPDICADELKDNGRQPPASCAFVPSVAGLMIAGEVIKDLIK